MTTTGRDLLVLVPIAALSAGVGAAFAGKRQRGYGAAVGAGVPVLSYAGWRAYTAWQLKRQTTRFQACLAERGITRQSADAISSMPDGADKEAALMQRVAAFDACAAA